MHICRRRSPASGRTMGTAAWCSSSACPEASAHAVERGAAQLCRTAFRDRAPAERAGIGGCAPGPRFDRRQQHRRNLHPAEPVGPLSPQSPVHRNIDVRRQYRAGFAGRARSALLPGSTRRRSSARSARRSLHRGRDRAGGLGRSSAERQKAPYSAISPAIAADARARSGPGSWLRRDCSATASTPGISSSSGAPRQSSRPRSMAGASPGCRACACRGTLAAGELVRLRESLTIRRPLIVIRRTVGYTAPATGVPGW